MTHTFKPEDTVAQLFEHVAAAIPTAAPGFTLECQHPRKAFRAAEHGMMTLEAAGLVPSAAFTLK